MATTRKHFDLFSYKKNKDVVLPGVLLVLVVIFSFLVLVPQVKGVFDDIGEIRSLEKQIEILSEKAVLLGNLNPVELDNQVRGTTEALASEEDLGYFLTGIKSMARESGVFFEGVRLLSSESKEQVRQSGPPVARKSVRQKENEDAVMVSVSLSGSFERLRNFVVAVENSVPIATITDFIFNNKRDAGLLSADISMKFHFVPLPESLGKVDEPIKVITAAEEQAYFKIEQLSRPETVDLPRVPTGNADLML